MSKSISTKLKPPPWIPAGRGIPQYKKPVKTITKHKSDDPVSPKTSPKRMIAISKDETCKDVEADTISLSIHSSYGIPDEPDVHHIAVLQEMKLLYVHFESLKATYISAHRLIDYQDIEDSNINDLFIEIGMCMKKISELLDDLEYAVSVLENTSNENQKKVEYSTVFKIKEKLLSKLLDMYDKVILVFQTVFEKLDFKELCQMRDSLSKKLQVTEKKSISQEAVIRDLERRLSIYQSKASAIENYKTNLEDVKADLEKKLEYKDTHIKYLSNELKNASGRHLKSDHEEFIEIIEGIKSKAHSEKSALKKALKFQRTQSEKNEERYQNLVKESGEKEKMIYEIASQRDQLKVQLTTVSNNIIQQKNQIEEMKIQNHKLQNELDEKDTSHKKEISQLKNNLEEKSFELDKLLKTKKKLEENVEELECELKKTKEQVKALKEEIDIPKSSDLHKFKETDVMHEEIQRLVSLLQNAKEVFESLKQSRHVVSAGGDHATNGAPIFQGTEFDNVQEEILTAVKETREHLLELKNIYKSFLQTQKEIPDQPEQKVYPKKNDLEKQFKKMEKLYNSALEENEALKQEVEELKNSASSSVQKTENYFTAKPNDTLKKLQMELVKKSDEIFKMKYDFKHKEKDLEDQLRDCRHTLKTMEVDSTKISSLEEDLKNTKLELSFLQKKKEEEIERLLQRTKELQDSLDLKSAELESLQRYIDLLKSSYSNVFCDS